MLALTVRHDAFAGQTRCFTVNRLTVLYRLITRTVRYDFPPTFTTDVVTACFFALKSELAADAVMLVPGVIATRSATKAINVTMAAKARGRNLTGLYVVRMAQVFTRRLMSNTYTTYPLNVIGSSHIDMVQRPDSPISGVRGYTSGVGQAPSRASEAVYEVEPLDVPPDPLAGRLSAKALSLIRSPWLWSQPRRLVAERIPHGQD
ncbi:hypothetical protein AB0O34_34785 [Sphaerisporangium sp. NPDC088356]|uniref:hypothetical protein n=1 Tax=Sphaerisporangium sp. NPDC088356 TaxID=3154871 RepID=UPI003434F748